MSSRYEIPQCPNTWVGGPGGMTVVFRNSSRDEFGRFGGELVLWCGRSVLSRRTHVSQQSAMPSSEGHARRAAAAPDRVADPGLR